MFFAGAPDIELKQLTGSFPATFRENKDTHPLFVLTTSPTGHYVCPCSTKGNPNHSRYIRSGCKFTGGRQKDTDEDSYLVERYAFTLPLDQRFSRKLIFVGIVPEECIEDRRRRT